MIPNYVIPNEYETLFQLSQGSGLSVALEVNAAPFIKAGTLKSWPMQPVFFRKLALIANKKKADPAMLEKMIGLLNR